MSPFFLRNRSRLLLRRYVHPVNTSHLHPRQPFLPTLHPPFHPSSTQKQPLTPSPKNRRLLPHRRRHPLLRPLHARNGQRPFPSSLSPIPFPPPPFYLPSNPLTSSSCTDPLPNRPNHHNRPAKNRPLLRAQAEAQGHGRLLRRAGADPAALAARRVPGGAVRHHGAVWGLFGDHCWLCEGGARGWAVDWGCC